MSTDVFLIVTTTAEKSDAEMIARALVEQRLAACVQIGGPITSCYRWEGKIETSQEWVCTVKTLQRKYAEVEQTIRRLHPYDEPEILATPVAAGAVGYLRWLEEEVSG